MAVPLLCIRVELCLWGLVVKAGVGVNLEDLGLDSTIILNLILKK